MRDMLRLADINHSEEEDGIAKLQPDALRSKWRHIQIQNQKYLYASIDSTWRKSQVSALSGSQDSQRAFSELVLRSDHSSDDFITTDFDLSECAWSERIPKWVDGPLTCDIAKDDTVQNALTIPCLSGWLLQKKSSNVAFLQYFSKWKKSWFVVVAQLDSLILNRYDGDAFSTPAKSIVLDPGYTARREQGLDRSDRFCFSVSAVDCKTRIVLAGACKAQAEHWVATLNSVITEMHAEDK
jgi:hypothetical protein